MGWNAKKNCSNCDFKIEQINYRNDEIPVCILTNKQVGLLENCKKYKPKTGEHITT